jgi:glutamyl-tRNA synthetase
MQRPIRVRFAPSPTGPLHIGGVRTALYNYLFAKKNQGSFVLRIEDTDRARFIPGAEAYIVDTLHWLGIEPDEGPNQGGEFGPYKQSSRNNIYPIYVQQLLETGKAYYAFDTPEELDAMRERLKAAKVVSPQYNAVSRAWMKNSLTLPQEIVAAKMQAGEPYVVRIKMPHKEVIRFYDQVRGWVKVDTTTLDDKVLMKSDGIPTYHLANVVDDYLMQITHVIRGEEWLPSTPLHILLYQYLGWEKMMPQFVHLPLLLKPEGHGKLSKRDAEKHGFPIFPLAWQDPVTGTCIPGFREKGYLPDALLNFLALLGWNPGNDQELLDKPSLIQAFSLERIGRSGVKFDIQKAMWFNQHYLRKQPATVLKNYLIQALEQRHIIYDAQQIDDACQLIQERTVFPQDFWEQGQYFFQVPEQYDTTIIQNKWTKQVTEVLQALVEIWPNLKDFKAASIKESLSKVLETQSLKRHELMPAIRVALTGLGAGPDLMRIMEILGQQECIQRLTIALQRKKPIN